MQYQYCFQRFCPEIVDKYCGATQAESHKYQKWTYIFWTSLFLHLFNDDHIFKGIYLKNYSLVLTTNMQANEINIGLTTVSVKKFWENIE